MTRTHAVVALVGRPNVGKSTLFNRLLRRRSAIVEKIPGVTRDRHFGLAQYRRYQFLVVDTGGFEPAADTSLLQMMRFQAILAVEEADVALMVVDAREGWTPSDEEIYRTLNESGKPLFLAANKADHPGLDVESLEFSRLGTDRVYPVSAEHDRGIETLLEAVNEVISLRQPEESVDEGGAVRVAVVGKPNAGKSSIVNALLHSERMIVDSLPGTTRDPVDSLCRHGNQAFLFVDTAGIRRKGRVSLNIETFSIVAALRAIERAEVALLVVDASELVTEQVMRVAGYVNDRKKAVVIVLNKWDLIDPRKLSVSNAVETVRERMGFIQYAPVITVSAQTGKRVSCIFDEILRVREQYTRRIQTSDLNTVLRQIVSRHPPPAKGGRPTKVYYGNQISVAPPTFVFMTNHPDKTNFSYDRYVTNQLRYYFGFEGVPLRLIWRKKSSGRSKKTR